MPADRIRLLPLMNLTDTERLDMCEYCGQPGHDWSIHPEARADVRDWEREAHRLEFPFGDYSGG